MIQFIFFIFAIILFPHVLSKPDRRMGMTPPTETGQKEETLAICIHYCFFTLTTVLEFHLTHFLLFLPAYDKTVPDEKKPFNFHYYRQQSQSKARNTSRRQTVPHTHTHVHTQRTNCLSTPLAKRKTLQILENMKTRLSLLRSRFTFNQKANFAPR